MKKCVVWDWNGTLLDDVGACIQAMDLLLKRRGLPALGGVERYRRMFTFPVREYYRAAGLDLDREPFPALAEEYLAEYARLAKGCGPRPGAREALARLRERGWRQVIASASAQEALEEQVRDQGLLGYFEALLGVDNGLGGGKEGVAGAYLAEQALSAQNVVFVGDTVHDWQVARTVGCPCVLVAGGHQDTARLEATGAPVVGGIFQAMEKLRSTASA
ncbi:MAG: HAD family hydrolase [Acutalibacter sp.]|nr:HAD family hydrolase [Acutalibacter sp.]